jgi:hypothetical protein
MITQEDLPEYIEKALPELSGLCKRKKCRNSYDLIGQMLQYTHVQVMKHNMQAAKDCLALAEQFYKKGNVAVRSAIENAYVYSFSRTFFNNEKMKNEMIKIVPFCLYDVYKKQVVNSHL